MYLKHYNLTSKPFAISPDPKFLWLGKKHREALAALKYGILDNKGFISLTGDVGTGKTTLINALANSLADNTIFALVPEPSLVQLDFLNITADAFKMDKKFSTKGEFLNHLKHFLNDAYVHHKEVVLVIEESQRFDQERLEEVRLISNIEKPDRKLITIVFVGQNEFNNILIKNKSLRQRIAINHKIEPLLEIETKQYILHRLKIAGSERTIFSPEAVRGIYSFSEGNPRLINIICDFALLTGYAKDIKIIEPEIIRECAANCLTPKQQKEEAIVDLRASSTPIPESGTGLHPTSSGNSYQIVAKKVREKPARLKLAHVPPLFVVILLSIFGYLYFVGENRAPYRDFKTFLGQTFEPYSGSKSETSSQKSDEITVRQANFAGTQVQALDLNTQKTSIENQLGQLRSPNEVLAADLEEITGAKERVVELEREVLMLETMISQSQQKVAKLVKELNQETASRELLSSELSSKVDLIAELREKLKDSQSNALEAEAKIENSTKKINELQKNLLNLKTEKVSAETQLGQLRASYAGLSADIQELKGAKERVTELEGAVAMREQTLAQSEQKVTDLTKTLDQEKKGREQLRTELSTQADQVAELEQKLETALSRRTELEKDIEKSRSENSALEGQLLELKTQMASSDSRLSEVKSRNDTLAADLEGLKGAKERVAELEGVVAMREQTLAQSEQKVTDLTNALDHEKKGRERLRTELSTQADQVAELEQKLETALSSRAELENDVKIDKNKMAEVQQKLQTSQTNQQGLEKTIEKSEKKIAELQNQLKGLEAQQAPSVSSPVPEIADLQGQLSDLKAQKTFSDAQLSELRSRNEAFAADLEELKGVKELVSALEGELAARDQVISSSEQRLAHLAKELDQEKKSGERLRSELSSKVDMVAEQQEKLENSQSKVLVFETQTKDSNIKITELKEQLLELKSQKASSESQLSEMKSNTETLAADLAGLKEARERTAALERLAAMREQKVTDLTSTLEQEKKGREQLRTELSAKTDQVVGLEQKLETALSSRAELENDVEISINKIAEFQQKLQTSQANQQELEKTIEKSEREITGLQNQLKGPKAQQTPTEPSPGIADKPKKSISKSETFREQGDSPSPFAIIDSVLKKKAK
jgi:type II secretory pathway predicted ATPase ExeA/chromosome segregation ATPase